MQNFQRNNNDTAIALLHSRKSPMEQLAPMLIIPECKALQSLPLPSLEAIGNYHN